MELTQHRCKNCGGTLEPFREGKLKCSHCASLFDVESAEKNTKKMQQLFDDVKQEAINNLRRNLYNAVHAEYVSSNDVHEICAAIKQYLPDDFQANFYDIATGSNVRQITDAIRRIDVKTHYEDLDGILDYLIRSMQVEFLLELNNLVERAYKLRDLSKFEMFSTAISQEAQKVQMGIYETKLPREVFVAYSSKDMNKVSELVEILEAQGMKCFVAARNLRHGKGAVENYDRALKEAMEHCKSFVFVSSRNSRSIGCDALEIEIPYIQKKDMENAPPEYRNNYAAIPHRYKKPRVEYRVEESIVPNAADVITNEFFDGYERVYSPDEVAHRIMKQLIQTPEETPPPRRDTAPTPKKYCAGCGHENILETKFCSQCGHTEFVSSIAEFIRLNQQKQEEIRLQTQRELKEAARQAEEAKKEAERQRQAAKQAQERANAQASSHASTTTRSTSSYSAPTSHASTAVYSGPKSDKNPWVAFFLCMFLGGLGAHRFYAGKKASGIFYIFSFGGFGIGILIDLFSIFSGKFKDDCGLPLGFTKKKSAKSVIGIIVAAYMTFIMIAAAILVIAAIIDGLGDAFSTSDLPDSSYGDSSTEIYENGLVYTMADGGWSVAVEDGMQSSLMGDLEIPHEMDGMDVVSIPEYAFANCTQLTSVTVPDSVKTIGKSAFNGCSRLKSITLPFVGSTRTAKEQAAMFGYIFGSDSYSGGAATQQDWNGDDWNVVTYYIPAQLTDVTITNTQAVADFAFANCTSLKTVTLNDDLISIGMGAFGNCTSLRTFTVPDPVTEITAGMMFGCTSLKEFYFNSVAVTSIGEQAFANCGALTRVNSYEDGSFIFSNEITFIGKGALNGCVQLKSLVLPFVGESRSAQENAAMFGYIFGDTSYAGGKATVQDWNNDNWNEVTYYLPSLLKTVEITDALTVADYAFKNCSSLTELRINGAVKDTASANAFVGCIAPTYMASSYSPVTIH